ncbi:hypothetical protein PY257_00665, partial [Ramlibacter sp. H39-3-26]
RQALIVLSGVPDDPGNAAFMSALLGPLYVELDALRDEFGLHLTIDAVPEWQRWSEQQDLQKIIEDKRANS